MKLKLWLIAIPFIAMFSMIQATFDWGEQGKLESQFLRSEIYPLSKNINGIMTNIKFKFRGPRASDPNIVIVAADDISVEKLGRWPWHREIYAQIIHTLYRLGAKHVAMDVVFSEPEERIPTDIYDKIRKLSPKLEGEIKKAIDGDSLFSEVINEHRNDLVLGYIPTSCQPFYDKAECPVDNKYNNESVEASIGKFSLGKTTNFTIDQLKLSPMSNILAGIFPIPSYQNVAKHAGYFTIVPDPDGFVRRYPLVMIGNNKVYTALASKMAELIKQDELVVDFMDDTRIEKIYFSKQPDQPIPATKLGYIDLNFKGPRESYPYVSALDILLAAEGEDQELTNKITNQIKDKSIFFGVSAIGLYDMRAFPFDSNTPGVEGHATALNNLLAMDSLKSASSIKRDWLPLTLIIVVGLVFAILFSALEAVPGLLVFVSFVAGFQYIDIFFLFAKKNINLPSALIYLETFFIFALILSIRYILEEKKKKHIKAAFSHYLAPSVVEMVLKDPAKLTVGGERRDLTILFSDLRGFTTISEGMDPKTLSQFLNEYLTAMTDCVFDNEGTLDKYIGDAVMAFWGAPIHQEDHILRACTAACLMQKKLSEIAPDFKQRYNIDVGMGVGVNSGTVSVGNMGSQKIFEYTVLGDHVNLASRLEGLTRIYGVGVLSTKSTMELLEKNHPGKIHYRVLDSVKVKGKKVATDLVEVSLDPFNVEADSLFQKSRSLFMNRNWDEAKRSFEESNRIFFQERGSDDPVANMYMNRCEYFKSHPPAENWDGSIEMKEK